MERTLLKFYADWCGPCKMYAPTVAKVASEHGLRLVSVNIDQERETAEQYGVCGIPTLILLEDEKEVARHTGAQTQARTTVALGLS